MVPEEATYAIFCQTHIEFHGLQFLMNLFYQNQSHSGYLKKANQIVI